MFELTLENAAAYLVERGVVARGRDDRGRRAPGRRVRHRDRGARRPRPATAFVVKQALPQLRVRDEWLATPDRAETEVAAMALCGAITPGVVPAIIDSDPAAHALVMELIPPDGEELAGGGGGGTRPRRCGSLGGRDARRLAPCNLRGAVAAGLRRPRGVRAAAAAAVPRDGDRAADRSSRTGSTRSSTSSAPTAAASSTATTRSRTCSSARTGTGCSTSRSPTTATRSSTSASSSRSSCSRRSGGSL